MVRVEIRESLAVGDGCPLLIIAGPCVIESPSLCLDVAGRVRDLCGRLGLSYVFKASFDKANRTSISAFRGPGLDEGLSILSTVREQVGVPVLSDIHLPQQAGPVSKVLDVIQIPAFLCRQTDLLVAAGETGLPVNIKKGQFLAPGEMRYAVEKVRSCNNNRVLLCERGTSFGYNNLVADMRAIPLMKQVGCPVIFDATHSAQRPGGLGRQSGGDRDLAGVLAAAAVAAGADGIFIETHPQPDKALCDAATMLPITSLEPLLRRLRDLARLSGRT